METVVAALFMTEDIDASKVVQPTIDFVDTPLDAIRNNKRQLRQKQEHVGMWQLNLLLLDELKPW